MSEREPNRETVTFPSDIEMAELKVNRMDYTRTRSGLVKIYTREEIAELSKSYPEINYNWDIWLFERGFSWLVNSASCEVKDHDRNVHRLH